MFQFPHRLALCSGSAFDVQCYGEQLLMESRFIQITFGLLSLHLGCVVSLTDLLHVVGVLPLI